ncbi:hypothetical protein ACFQ6Q_00210 [Streptomyces sp. NPDC056437]|uniref:hypothetical protein n=1 Tax=Streptomyces sp. NPDC056437 TaxID=3345816 RepID=UPI0036BB85C3
MAIEYAVPHTAASDMMTLKEIASLLQETDHGKSVTTLKTWIKDRQIHTERRGRRKVTYVSYSRILEVHRDVVVAELAAEGD